MKTEFILYGLKLNEPDYLESIIHTTFNRNEIDKVKTLAIKKGYVNELSKSRTVTLALLVGIIIGYILGNVIPLDK